MTDDRWGDGFESYEAPEREIPPEVIAKLEAITDPGLRQSMADMYVNLLPDAKVETLRRIERTEKAVHRYEMNLRMMSKARKGEYGEEVKFLLEGIPTNPPFSNTEHVKHQWWELRKLVYENKIDPS